MKIERQQRSQLKGVNLVGVVGSDVLRALVGDLGAHRAPRSSADHALLVPVHPRHKRWITKIAALKDGPSA